MGVRATVFSVLVTYLAAGRPLCRVSPGCCPGGGGGGGVGWYIPRSLATSASGEPGLLPGRWRWGEGVYIPRSPVTSVSDEPRLLPGRWRWGGVVHT